MTPTDMGLAGVQLSLAEYSPSALNVPAGTAPPITQWFTAYTNSSGYYNFPNLIPGDFYTIIETQPSGYTATADSVGHFLSSSGTVLTAPTGIGGVPASGMQTPGVPGLTYYIMLPPATTSGFGPNSSGGKYSAVDYNFGEYRSTPVIIPTPPTVNVPTVGANMSVPGPTDRFLNEPGSSLAVSATVSNTATPGSGNLNWNLSALSTGLSFTQTTGTNLAIGSPTVLTGSVAGGGALVSGIQSATLTVNGVSTTGKTLPSSSTSVTIDPLTPRQLTQPGSITVPSALGGLLYGAVVPVSYSVMSTTDSNHTTNVYVGGSSSAGQVVPAVSPGSATVGYVTVPQTIVSGPGTVNVPVTVEADALGPLSASATLSVATAELAAVHDTTSYPSLTMSYSISNVGWAATGGSNSTGIQQFGAPLSAPFAAGSQLSPSPAGSATLTSIVGLAGTMGSLSTATGPNSNTLTWSGAALSASNAYGTIGSECDILASTALSQSTTVTESWRARNSNENGLVKGAGNLPAGIQWLASDVVDIQGVPNDLSFAMQMSYDNNVNTFIGGAVDTATVPSAFIGKMNSSGQWVNAASLTTSGSDAQTPLNNAQIAAGTMSLSAFLSQYYNGTNLAQLAGSWGVDTATQESWAIVNGGGGQFAVVPEPSTCALLGAGLAGLLVYRFRRKARRKARRKSEQA